MPATSRMWRSTRWMLAVLVATAPGGSASRRTIGRLILLQIIFPRGRHFASTPCLGGLSREWPCLIRSARRGWRHRRRRWWPRGRWHGGGAVAAAGAAVRRRGTGDGGTGGGGGKGGSGGARRGGGKGGSGAAQAGAQAGPQAVCGSRGGGGGNTGANNFNNSPYNQPRRLFRLFLLRIDTTADSRGAGGRDGRFHDFNTNDLLGGLERIGARTKRVYILGYVPETRRKKLHTLKVKLNRGGMNARSRIGYCTHDRKRP